MFEPKLVNPYASEGVTEYTTSQGLLTTSSSKWPDTAVFQIHASGVPLDKIVIGKPALSSDAGSGYMAPSTLASCLAKAKKSKWGKHIRADLTTRC